MVGGTESTFNSSFSAVKSVFEVSVLNLRKKVGRIVLERQVTFLAHYPEELSIY